MDGMFHYDDDDDDCGGGDDDGEEEGNDTTRRDMTRMRTMSKMRGRRRMMRSTLPRDIQVHSYSESLDFSDPTSLPGACCSENVCLLTAKPRSSPYPPPLDSARGPNNGYSARRWTGWPLALGSNEGQPPDR